MEHYPVPDLPAEAMFRREELIKRSRFIVSIGHTRDPEAARAFVENIKKEFPEASHNCWAFVAGSPGDTARVGYSDDGEPHGTAGRPMLTVLLHGGVGEICAVVTRWFGGVKLGTGGLVRAYQGVVRQALEELPTRIYMPPEVLEVIIDYTHMTRFKRLLAEYEAQVLAEQLGADAAFTLCIPKHRAGDFAAALTEMTGGAVLVQREEEGR